MKLVYLLLFLVFYNCTNLKIEEKFSDEALLEQDSFSYDENKFKLGINNNLLESFNFYRSLASVENLEKTEQTVKKAKLSISRVANNKAIEETKHSNISKITLEEIKQAAIEDKLAIGLKYIEPSPDNLISEIKPKILKEKKIYNNKYKFNKLLIEPNLFFSTFKSTDTIDKAVSSIISRSNLGLSIAWVQNYKTKKVKEKIKTDEAVYKNEQINIDSDLSTSVYIDYNKYIFIKGSDSTLLDNTKDIISFGTKIVYKPIDDLSIAFKAYYGQELYFDSFIFNEANIYGAKLGLNYSFLDLDPYKLGFSLEAGLFNGTKIKDEYNIKLAKTYEFALYLQYENLKAEIKYDITKKDTEIYYNTEDKVIFKFSYIWSF